MRRHTSHSSTKGYKEFKDDIITPLDIKRNRLSRIYSQETDSGFHSNQFKQSNLKNPIPWKAIALATFLFIGGSVSLIVCILSLAGHIDLPPDVPTGLLVLGLLMFVPGFYHVRIAYGAYQEYPGYSFDDLISCNDY
jgi:hypothetical protein